MKIYGFVGKSGTGKSFQAMNVCHKKGIEAIIDDGLLIYENAVVAGHSAKRDKNKMTAIKTAVFNDDEDRLAVRKKLQEISPNTLLILGTSVGMVEKICDRLEINRPDEIIFIEDVATKDAINTALRQRREQGKHVIPVPAVAIKPQFSGYFMMPLKIFKRGKNNKTIEDSEKSVVRPTYSYMGVFTISDKAVEQIVISTCLLHKAVSDVVHCRIENSDEGVKINVGVIVYYLPCVRKAAIDLQKFLCQEVEMMTAFNIIEVKVGVKAMMPGEYGLMNCSIKKINKALSRTKRGEFTYDRKRHK